MSNPITITFTTVTKDSPGAGQVTIVGTYGTGTTYTQPAQRTTVGNFPVPTFSRAIQLTEAALFCIRNGAANNIALDVSTMQLIWNALSSSMTFAPYIATQPSNAACAGTAQATGTLTSNNTTPTDGDTVTIGINTYTFKTALTSVEGQVLINGSADAALLNLIRAINHTGTPNTDYFCAAANTQVTAASSVTSHHFAVTAITSGVGGNTIGSTTASAGTTLTWGSATLTGGTVAATTFTQVSTSEIAQTYQWQYSLDGATSWTNASGTVNGCAYTNGTTATLTCTPTTNGQTGYFHRCNVTNSIGTTATATVTLTIP